MSAQVSKGSHKGLVIGLIAILLVVIVVPIGYCFVTYDAVKRLIIHTPTLEVTRDGWSIYLTLAIKVENPTSTPIPTLDILFDCTLDGYTLFYSEKQQIGSLDAHSTATLGFTTVINFALAYDLFMSLVNYLAGNPVSYYFCFSISMHLLVNFPVFEVKRSGVFELY